MAKYKSHKAALIGTIKELESKGFYHLNHNAESINVDDMTPDECSEYINNVIESILDANDKLVDSIKDKEGDAYYKGYSQALKDKREQDAKKTIKVPSYSALHSASPEKDSLLQKIKKMLF